MVVYESRRQSNCCSTQILTKIEFLRVFTLAIMWLDFHCAECGFRGRPLKSASADVSGCQRYVCSLVILRHETGWVVAMDDRRECVSTKCMYKRRLVGERKLEFSFKFKFHYKNLQKGFMVTVIVILNRRRIIAIFKSFASDALASSHLLKSRLAHKHQRGIGRKMWLCKWRACLGHLLNLRHDRLANKYQRGVGRLKTNEGSTRACI